MKNIKNRFHILGIVLTLIIVIGLTIQYSYFDKVATQIKQENILITRETLVNTIGEKIKYYSQLIDTSSQIIGNNNWDDDAIQEYMNGIARSNPLIKTAYYADVNNKLISSDNWEPPAEYNTKIRPWYKMAVEKNSLVISEVYTSVLYGYAIVSISTPVYNNDQLIGVLSSDITVNDIIKIVEETKIDGSGYSFLIDESGNILAHPDYEYRHGSGYTHINSLDSSQKGIYDQIKNIKLGQIETELDNTKGYLSFKTLADTGWIIGNFISYKEFKGDNDEIWRMFFIGLVTSVFIFSSFTLVQRKSFLEPILKLDVSIQMIDVENNIKYRLPTSNKDPFKEIKQTLNQVLATTQSLFEQVDQDKEEIIAQNDDLNYLSYNDQLTGLYNRRYFEKHLEILDTQENLPLTLIMGDANGLKLINDSFGHKAGDELLIRIGEILTKECRDNDVVARISGDEFVVILPKTNEEGAEKIIRRIQKASEESRVTCDSFSNIEVSVSYGYKTKHNMETDILEVLNIAEGNMYEKKLYEGPSMRRRTMETILEELYNENKYKKDHHKNVSNIAGDIGRELGLSKEELKDLKRLGIVHDIGEIAVSSDILNTKRPLTAEELGEIKKHPEISYRILNTLRETSKLAEYTLHHHERYDGAGYPKGLIGEDIPLLSRIITIADAYDAMRSNRPYGRALDKEEIIRELIENAGTQFDPVLTRLFIEKILKEEWTV